MLGLAHVVEALTERRGGWDVLDLLTDERFRRPFKWKQGEHVDAFLDGRGWVACEVVQKTDGCSVRVRERNHEPRWMPAPEHEIRRDHLRLTDSVTQVTS